MTPEGSNDSAALNWVREDLDRCLDTVRDNLEAFADDPSRREALVAVQEELERLNLTFLTMQQRGASILTDEMIAVGGHLLHNGNANCSESLNALTDAIGPLHVVHGEDVGDDPPGPDPERCCSR